MAIVVHRRFSMLKTALYNIPFCSYIINLRCGFTGLFIDIDIIFAPVFPMCLRHRWTFARCSEAQAQAQARVHDIHRKSVYLNYKIDPIKHISYCQYVCFFLHISIFFFIRAIVLLVCKQQVQVL